mmetsp:Transcript_112063/g.157113  ORF Transcript_112063/g.157113 Transcript_112063/m.157113 type:complete len:660 (+) Transcript_112063:48-2027(+)
MAAGADETAEDLEGQVARLRNENSMLRELLTSAGLDTPALSASQQGGAAGAADALVALMAEGGSLLREREELILEHARLTVTQQAAEEDLPNLECLLEALLEVDALNAERDQLRAERGLPVTEEVDEFADALTKLRPLLGETDGLRAERERLVAERKGLLGAVEGAGLAADGLPLCEEDRDLELQLLGAVKGVAQENSSLKAEIQELREQIERLRSSSRSNGQPAEALPSLAAADKVPKAPIPRPFPQLLHRSAPRPALETVATEAQAPAPAPPSEPPPAETKAPVSAEVEKLQEIIQRLQAENAELKSQVVALTPQASSQPMVEPGADLTQEAAAATTPVEEPAPEVPSGEPVAALQAPATDAPAAPAAVEPAAAEEPITTQAGAPELTESVAEAPVTEPEAPPPTPTAAPEEAPPAPAPEEAPPPAPAAAPQDAEPAEAPKEEPPAPAPEEAPPAPALEEAPPAPAVEEAPPEPAPEEVPAVVVVTPVEDPPEVAPAPQASPELPDEATLKAPSAGMTGEADSQDASSKSRAAKASRFKPVKPRPPRLSPEEMLKQAGVPLTPEAMLKQLLSPVSAKKAALPRTELPPEDPDTVALQRQEAMSILLKTQLARHRDEGFELECRSRELSPSSKMLDVDATQEQAMKGALHTLFRSFGS